MAFAIRITRLFADRLRIVGIGDRLQQLVDVALLHLVLPHQLQPLLQGKSAHSVQLPFVALHKGFRPFRTVLSDSANLRGQQIEAEFDGGNVPAECSYPSAYLAAVRRVVAVPGGSFGIDPLGSSRTSESAPFVGGSYPL